MRDCAATDMESSNRENSVHICLPISNAARLTLPFDAAVAVAKETVDMIDSVRTDSITPVFSNGSTFVNSGGLLRSDNFRRPFLTIRMNSPVESVICPIAVARPAPITPIMIERKNGAARILALKYDFAWGRTRVLAPKNCTIGLVNADSTMTAVMPAMNAIHRAEAMVLEANSRSPRPKASAICGVVTIPKKLKHVNDKLKTLLLIPTPPSASAPRRPRNAVSASATSGSKARAPRAGIDNLAISRSTSDCVKISRTLFCTF
mmetsp:Transcript_33510/g.132193  ORF Transcript_33510/g.132193 Transcript_33510/m.132193 type:complete len:263 (-) Transcript_33510:795-1583(-)